MLLTRTNRRLTTKLLAFARAVVFVAMALAVRQKCAAQNTDSARPSARPIAARAILDPPSPPSRLPPVIPPDSAIFEAPASTVAMVPPSADFPGYVTQPQYPYPGGDLVSPEQAKQLMTPGEAAELTAPGEVLVVPPKNLPPGAKDGILQFATFRKTWLNRGEGPDGFGMMDLQAEAILAIPLGSIEKPLLITPSFTGHLLQGPSSTDLPPQVYDVQLEFRTPRQLTERLAMDLAVAPSIFSDFHNMSRHAYRVTGRGLALYQLWPEFQVVMGVAYLGRQDVQILPVGGFIWTPADNVRIEAIFPRPRFAHHFLTWYKTDWWWYAAGEFGGNSYAIERATGANDEFTYRDFRAVLGLEKKKDAGLFHRWEVGYVFGREIEYASGTPGITPPDTIMIRGEVGY